MKYVISSKKKCSGCPKYLSVMKLSLPVPAVFMGYTKTSELPQLTPTYLYLPVKMFTHLHQPKI